MRQKYFDNLSPSQKFLKGLLTAGIICLAAQSPYFFPALWKDLQRRKSWRIRENEEKFRNAFYYLKKQGYLNIKKVNRQIYISLTEKGKKKAGKYQIDSLKIEIPPKWDGKWRLVIFDIPNDQGIKREAFRGKLKEFGFYLLQKSIWIYPHKCEKEIKLLREFFGLTTKYLRIITVEEIEEDSALRKIFKL